MVDSRVAILQALLAGESYGLEIIDVVRRATSNRVVLAQARVYPMLHELEANGLVVSREDDASPQRAGRPRRYYTLTATGLRRARSDADALRRLVGFTARFQQ